MYLQKKHSYYSLDLVIHDKFVKLLVFLSLLTFLVCAEKYSRWIWMKFTKLLDVVSRYKIFFRQPREGVSRGKISVQWLAALWSTSIIVCHWHRSFRIYFRLERSEVSLSSLIVPHSWRPMSFLKLYLFQAALPNGVTKILLIWTWKCYDIAEPVSAFVGCCTVHAGHLSWATQEADSISVTRSLYIQHTWLGSCVHRRITSLNATYTHLHLVTCRLSHSSVVSWSCTHICRPSVDRWR